MLCGLRNPAKAAQTVAALRQNPPDLPELLLIIDKLAQIPPKSWPDPTLRWCAHQLAHTTDPLVRHFLATKLPLRSPEVANANLLALINSQNPEIAVHTRQNSPKAIDSLPITNFLAQNGVLPRNFTSSQWFSAFSSAVEEFNYEKSTKIWDRRGKFLSTPVSQPVLTNYVQLLGAYKDINRIKTVLDGVNFDLVSSDVVLSAVINCLPSAPTALAAITDHHHLISSHNLSDWSTISDWLVSDLALLLNFGNFVPTTVGNIVLNGIYRNYTSQMVFHVYRKLLSSRMVGDSTTAQILANAAYRLGNSKLLINGIYDEFRSTNLSRKFFETMLIIQLSGTGFLTAKYGLAEMRRHNIGIRPHIQRMVYNKFAKNSESFRDLTDPKFVETHKEFPFELATKESGFVQQQAQARTNLEVFLHGLHPDRDFASSLPQILQFEARRAAR